MICYSSEEFFFDGERPRRVEMFINVYLDLGLGHAQRVREFRPFRARQVLGLLEGLLEREDLLPAERGPRVLLLAVFVLVRAVHCVHANRKHSC